MLAMDGSWFYVMYISAYFDRSCMQVLVNPGSTVLFSSDDSCFNAPVYLHLVKLENAAICYV